MEGLVKVNPHHGVEVSQLSVEEVIEIYHIRGALESLAARLAVPNLLPDDFKQMAYLLDAMDSAAQKKDLTRTLEVNRSFHTLIWKASQSARLYDLLENYYDSSQRFRNVSIKVPGRLDRIGFEHRPDCTSFASGVMRTWPVNMRWSITKELPVTCLKCSSLKTKGICKPLDGALSSVKPAQVEFKVNSLKAIKQAQVYSIAFDFHRIGIKRAG